jgi:hypothetical protein
LAKHFMKGEPARVEIILEKKGQKVIGLLKDFSIDSKLAPLDVTVYGRSTAYMASGSPELTIRADYVATEAYKPLPPADTLERCLAYAVLEGDDAAACALVDELIERRRTGERFVSREVMAEALRPFAEWAEDYDTDSGASMSDDAPIRLLDGKTRPNTTLGHARAARDVLARYEEMMRT